MSVHGSKVVDVAKADRGKHEDPMGSNSGAFVERCQRATFLAGTGWPWCAAAVCYWAAQAGVPLAYNGAGAHDLADHHPPAVPRDQWRAGMVVDFNIGSGHTGVLVSHTDATVTTVDGNWADSVVEHVSDIGLVRKVWRIPGVSYGSTVAPQPPIAKPPRWVVTTSANGTKKVVFRTRRKRNLIAWLTGHNIGHLFPNGVTIKRGTKR